MDNMLLKACQNGQKGVVEAFLKRGGMNLNRGDNDGCTPLHIACYSGNAPMVKLLLEYGADSTLSDDKGRRKIK